MRNLHPTPVPDGIRLPWPSTDMLAAKDPEESIVLTFDFSSIAATLANPEITVDVVSGTDADATSMCSGAPQVDGGRVLQLVVGGMNGADYRFRCAADADSGPQRFAVTATLRVRKR